MTAEAVYVDPSALARLYIHQTGSQEIAAWRRKLRGALSVTHHARTEIINAICRAAFIGQLNQNAMAEALADFSSDYVSGHLQQADILWRAALNRAGELSRRYTPSLGTRSLDVLHVACALELRLRHFLTFDDRQQQLAVAAGLKLVRL
jgi:predicted nucleic acid-binding protein